MPAPLARVLRALETLAPTSLAEPWDNVGLILPAEDENAPIERALFTIDLTEPVLAEAVELGADLVVSYHPPLFEAIKRIDLATPTGRLVTKALRHGIAVYSPHTALDAAPGGMNDWLADGVGDGERLPLEPRAPGPGGVGAGGAALEGAGMGRLVTLDPARALDAIVTDLKAHLGKRQLRVAASARHANGEPITDVALCAGAGGALFAKLGAVDLLVTGELRHHDVLGRVARGTSVILCEHTGSERGFLPIYAREIEARLDGAIETSVSRMDEDPIDVV